LTLIRLFPSFAELPRLSAEEQSWEIAKAYGICNGWRINFAVNDRGESFGASGSSLEVSSELDRLLLGKIRSQADVIVTSGKTARAEKYRSSKHAPIAIFTNSGDLDAVPAIQGTQYFTPIVLTSAVHLETVEDALADVDVRVLAYDSVSSNAWPVAIDEVLRHEGFQSPVLESGLESLRSFIHHGVVSEVCLSVTLSSGRQVSARELATAHLQEFFGVRSRFELLTLFSDGQTLFSRWAVRGVA
jgi:riboflavin biosynthesis pyrimidine reductase